jgi:hypothetical protein
MSRYFAELDSENRVLRVIVVRSARYAKKLAGGLHWVETFMNRPDKNYCGRGWIWDNKRKNFYPPMPDCTGYYLDEEKLLWKPNETHDLSHHLPPDTKPSVMITSDNKIYRWNNNLIRWEEIIT